MCERTSIRPRHSTARRVANYARYPVSCCLPYVCNSAEALAGRKVSPSQSPLSTFLVDPGEPFQSGTHTDIDPDRPQRQLIFAALSPDYVVLCFWIGDWPADVRYMMVIRRDGSTAKQAFYCTVDGEAKTLKDVRRLLRKGQVSVLGVS